MIVQCSLKYTETRLMDLTLVALKSFAKLLTLILCQLFHV